MSKVFLAIVAVCLVQLVVARVQRAAPPAAASTTDAWQDVVKASKDTLDTLHTAILNLNGVTTDDELISKVTTQAQTVGNRLQTQVTELTKEAQKNAGQFEGVYKDITDKLAQVANDLKNKNKDLFDGDTKKIQESIEKELREVVEKSDELKTKLKTEGDNVSSKIETLFASIVELANNGAKDFTKAIKEKST